MGKGIVKLAPLSDKVPQQIRDLSAKKRQTIVDHKLQVFTGSIKDQTGKVVLAQGKTFGDKEPQSMNFFIEGVQGTIQKKNWQKWGIITPDDPPFCVNRYT